MKQANIVAYLLLALSLAAPAHAETTKFNPFTGKPDYVGLSENGDGSHLTGITAKQVGARKTAYLTAYLPQNYVVDGSADYSGQIQAWLNSGETPLYAPSGVWRADTAVSVPDGVDIFGDGDSTVLDFSHMPAASSSNYSKPGITLTGTATVNTTLTASVSAGAQSLSVADSSAFAAGDLIWIVSSGEPSIPGFSGAPKAELLLVDTVDTGVINVRGSSLFGYDNATYPVTVYRVNPVASSIHDLKIILGGKGSGHTGIKATYTKGLSIERVTIDGGEESDIVLWKSYAPSVKECTISGSTSPNFTFSPTYNSGYGVLVGDGTKFADITGNRISNCKHGVAGGGSYPVLFAMVEKNKVTGCGRLMNGYTVAAYDNAATYTAGDLVLSGGSTYKAKLTVSGVTPPNSTYWLLVANTAAMDAHEPTFYWNYNDNRIIGNFGGGMVLRGQHITANNNKVVNNNGPGIQFAPFSTMTALYGVTVSGNSVVNNVGGGILVDGGQASPTVQIYDVAITGNTVIGNSSASHNNMGIYLRYANRVNLTGNDVAMDTVQANSGYPVYALNTNDLTVTGGTLYGNTSYYKGIYASGGTNENIVGVNYRNTAGTTLDAGANITNSIGPSGLVNTRDVQNEPAMGNPGTDGYVLSSTAAGVRSWIPSGVSLLSGLTDTNISSPANNNLFLYQTSDNKWHNTATIAMANLPTTGTWGQASGGLNFGSTPSFLIDSTNKTVVYYYLPASSDSSVKPFVTRRKGNTSNSTGAQLNTNVVGAIEMEGWDGSNYRPSGWIKTVAKEDFSSTASGGKVVISTMTPGATATAGTSALMADTQYDRVAIDNTGVVVSGTVTGTQIISTVATGTAPFSVTSTTEVPNLKSADSGKLNGQTASFYAPKGTLTSGKYCTSDGTVINCTSNGTTTTTRDIPTAATSENILTSDRIVTIEANASGTTAALPSPASMAGVLLSIKNRHASNTLTVSSSANGGFIEDGGTTSHVLAGRKAVQLICDGTNWFIVGGY